MTEIVPREAFSKMPASEMTCLKGICFDVFVQVARYVWNKADFDAVDPEKTDYLMGTRPSFTPEMHDLQGFEFLNQRN